jgi:hypothetical protein
MRNVLLWIIACALGVVAAVGAGGDVLSGAAASLFLSIPGALLIGLLTGQRYKLWITAALLAWMNAGFYVASMWMVGHPAAISFPVDALIIAWISLPPLVAAAFGSKRLFDALEDRGRAARVKALGGRRRGCPGSAGEMCSRRQFGHIPVLMAGLTPPPPGLRRPRRGDPARGPGGGGVKPAIRAGE